MAGAAVSTASAKLLIYQAFIQSRFGIPKHLARRVHELYLQPVHEEFQAQTMWSAGPFIHLTLFNHNSLSACAVQITVIGITDRVVT